MKNNIYLDFEYNESSEQQMNVVCCSVESIDGVKEFWLHNGANKEEFKEYLSQFTNNIFVAYAAEAEASALLSIGVDPLQFKWIDLYLEYRHLLNHNHKLQYGKQLIQGRKKFTRPPKNKWKMTEEDKIKSDMSKPEYGLAAACYKLLDVEVDTDFKTATRDLIISAPKEFTEEEKETIVSYCTSDIKYLKQLLEAQIKEYKTLLNAEELKTLKQEMFVRGEYAVRTAKMVRFGYPINLENTQAFSSSVSGMLYDLQKEITELFPQYAPFELNKKTRKHVWKQANTKDALALEIPPDQLKRWVKTEKKSLSLSAGAFEKFFHYRHDYPKDVFGAQMLRFLKFKQQLNGFLPSSGKKKKSFWDYVGKDARVRPYFGIYGSQSSRSQPAATGFIFLKSAWMRALCEPPKGRAICGIDFGSQEFLLAALVSKDVNMIKAYLSGDPYLYFAKLAGAVPWEGTKAEYAEERNLFKSTTLGLSYGMMGQGLANKLSQDTGKKVSVHEAERLISKFKRAYPKYERYKKQYLRDYCREGKGKLACGWMMWGDNDNDKSITNFPIQGLGASIMRKAVALAQDAGLDVIMTLHDALYIEMDSGDMGAIDTLGRCMQEAFEFYFEGKVKEYAKIRLDADIWSKDYPEETIEFESEGGIPVIRKHIYIDPRAKKQYEQFKKYFTPINWEEVDI